MISLRRGRASLISGLALLVLALVAPAVAVAQTQTPSPPADAPPTPASAPLTLTSQTPEAGKLIVERRPVISFSFDPETVDPKSVSLEVDGADVTLFARVEGGKVTFVPPSDLKHGERTVRVAAMDKNGAALQPAEWKFKVRRFARLEDASLGGELSTTYEAAVRKPVKEPTDDSGVSHKTETPVHNLQNNLAVRGMLKEGDFTAKLDANIRYADDFRPRPRPKSTAEKLDIANYLINLDRRPLTFELGDVLVNEGFFGAPGLSRRGMHLVGKDEQRGLHLHLFGTRFETTRGHDPFFGPEDPDSVLVGGALGYTPFADRELLRLHVLNVRGHRYSTSPGVNVGTIVSGERGDLWSFGTSSTFLGGKLKAMTEIAFSEYDTNVTDSFHEQADKAWRVRLEGGQDVVTLLDAPVTARWGAELAYVGFEFRSPGNPGLQPDRNGWNVKNDLIWKMVTFTGGFASFHDNTDKLELIPRVRTFVWSGGLTLAPPPEWPSVGYLYNRSDQRSFWEPESHQSKGVDNVQDTHTLTFGLNRERWSSNLSLSMNLFDEQRRMTIGTQGGDRDTYTTQAGISMRPFATTTITPGFSYTLTREKTKAVVLESGEQALQPVRTQTMTGTLTVAHELLPKLLMLDLQGSGGANQTSDHTQDNQTYSAVGRITWNVGKLIGDWGRQALSLRVNWNRTLDHTVPRDSNQIGVFLILDLLNPYNL